MARPYSILTVNSKAERSLRGGHPWVYGEEVTSVHGSYQNGDIVDVCSSGGRWLGSGFINDRSKIMVRIISHNTNDRFDAAFFERRLRYAIDYRLTVMGQDFSACRLIFGEADQFPGFTVDKFNDVLVAEVLCFGIECRKQMLYAQILKILKEKGIPVKAIYERSDSSVREKEGLSAFAGYIDIPDLQKDIDNGKVMIKENDLLFEVDYINGQKTGFFLDQKYNRAAVAKLVQGKKVLDCFTHTGAFALNAAGAGAERVTAVDISGKALQQAKRNAQLNDLGERIDFICADVFDLLTELAEKKKHEYDLIILDPPAFTKSRTAVKNAFRGYKEINLKAMKLLPRGGFLATCSCSRFMPHELFIKMLKQAAADAQVSLRQIESRQQAPDHPILWNVPETDYLKFFIFQIV